MKYSFSFLLVCVELFITFLFANSFLPFKSIPINQRLHVKLLRARLFEKEFDKEKNSQRRKKVNKYEHLSQAKNNTLTKKIEQQEKERQELEHEKLLSTQKTIPRGTTVPIHQIPLDPSKAVIKKPKIFPNASTIIPHDPSTYGFIEIGVIVAPHGIHGGVKIILNSDFSEHRLRPNSLIYIKHPKRRAPRPIILESCKHARQNEYYLRFQNITNREIASRLSKYVLYANENDKPPLEEDEVMIHEILGVHCYFDHQRNSTSLSTVDAFAKVINILSPDELCDNKDLLPLLHSNIEIKLKSTKDLCMIPFIPEIITEIDLPNRRIFIDPPEGLLEMTYPEEKTKVVIRGFLPQQVSLTESQRTALENITLLKYPQGGVVINEGDED